MDEFTKKLLSDMEDVKLHPDDWRLIIRCTVCGDKHYFPCNKTEVMLYRRTHGSNIMPSICDKCAGVQQEEEEDEDA